MSPIVTQSAAQQQCDEFLWWVVLAGCLFPAGARALPQENFYILQEIMIKAANESVSWRKTIPVQ